MALTKAKWILKDAQSLETGVSGELQVKVAAAGAIERTADGINLKTGGITSGMFAADSVNAAALNEDVAGSGLVQNGTSGALDVNTGNGIGISSDAVALSDLTADWDVNSADYTITGLKQPVNESDAAPKSYVDAVAQGLDIKETCRVATTEYLAATYNPGNFTLTADANGALTLDGVTLSNGDRVLVKDQSRAEVSTVDMTGLNAAGLSGTYLTINSPTTAYYVWFDVDNGSTDPAVAGKTGIEVNIAAADTAAQIATKLASAIDAQAAFIASATDNVVTITNISNGASTDITAGNSGASVSVITQGVSGTVNGIYVVNDIGSGSTPWVMVRAVDFDGTPAGEVTAGTFTFVTEGTSYADTGWVLSTNDPIILDTTPLTFIQFSAAGTYSAGDGLTLSGTVFNVGASDGIQVNANDITVKIDGTTLSKSAAGLKVAAAGITATEISTTALGDGLTGGAGTAITVNIDGTTLSKSTSGLKVASEGITATELASSVAGDGLAGGAGIALSVNTGNGIQITSDAVALGTLSGDWNAYNGTTYFKISGVADPTADNDVANKAYVDAQVAAANNTVVETFTLTATDITNKYVTLASTPAVASDVVLLVKDAPNQFYGDDYQMDGIEATRLTWTGLALDGVLAEGDKFSVMYYV